MTEGFKSYSSRMLFYGFKPSPYDWYSNEAKMCAEFVKLAHFHLDQLGLARELLLHIPNGQRAGSKTARIIAGGQDKALGAQAGAPDYIFNGPAGAMYIEAKYVKQTREGKLVKSQMQPHQKEFAMRVIDAGYRYEVFYTPQQGLTLINEALEGKNNATISD